MVVRLCSSPRSTNLSQIFSGIHIPEGGFQLTEEEQNHIDNNHWVNFSEKEHEEQT